MILSVVTGTYNRLNSLQRMVASVRASIGFGLDYEIVLVDGGSKDGTIAWALSQQDIVLIQQGELLGAVKAFNEGAYAARGKYVLLANDDIDFAGLSITNAISFMQDNLDVGVGCFYQDRGGNPFYVDTMPAIEDGKQVRANYGQVCIVPKQLGDKVGWWGDYLHTYGGDNELSANILELGYKVSPVPCAYIHDYVIEDALRKVNRDHKDTKNFYDKWTHPDGLVGPVLKSSIKYPIDLQREFRIFYAPIYERGHAVQKLTKRGLHNALKKRGLLVEYDYINYGIEDIVAYACSIDPDLILTQFHDSADIPYGVMRELRANHPNAKFVNWNGDYHPEILFKPDYINLLRMFDLSGFVTTEVKDEYDAADVNWMYWQIGYEPADDRLDKYTPHHDVLFLGNCYSKERVELGHVLMQIKCDLGLYGFWPSTFRPKGTNLYDFDAGARLYKAAKIAISDSQWPNATGFVSNRLFQAMAAGAFLLQQNFAGLYECLGLKDGVHLVTWTDLDDLKDKINYWLKDENTGARNRIALAGKKYILSNHSFDRRVDELMDKLYHV